jgi:leucyl-tRNA synthetase
MQESYDPAAIEGAAQADWNARQAYRVVESAGGAKFYACSMLPYPSGKLHMGHVRNYTINDVMSRYMRMKGFNVLMPMGWDAFGLPAENAAIEKGIAPAAWTRQNIADMKAQMQPLGLSFDWSRELATCDPQYYKWNQWFFLKMLEHGIAYRKTQTVNWDPVDNTVLANEQVIDGRGWRSGAIVEKREVPGYYLRITAYTEELLDGVVNKLQGWPERVRLMQANWIGKSEGVNFGFPYTLAGEPRLLRVFTTRADTIMGVTFCAVAPEHPLAEHCARQNGKLAAFIEECKKGGVSEAALAAAEKQGMATGFFVTHPLTQEKIPVWVGNYVLMAYGEGAVMGVPAHDERDFEFAQKYALPIKQVIAAGDRVFGELWQDWYADARDGYLVNSGKYDGMTFGEAIDAIAADLAALGIGEQQTTYRLRDWGISRQRYWGTPIPIIHCVACGAVPVPYEDLPVVLPEDLVPDGSGNPLNKDERFLKASCPKCGHDARRETDTMDTFVDSSWYYMRYCSPDSHDAMVDARNDYWMPMDQYIGGIEHAVLHLLYARFWTKVMRDLNLVSFDEPFTRLFTQGMLLNECFYREEESGKKRWFYPSEVEVKYDEKGKPIGAVAVEDHLPVLLGGIEKMSKSKNNVVEPRHVMQKYGADTARFFSMFAGPPEQSAVYSDSGIEGAYRFLRRLWAYCHAKRELLQAPRDALHPAQFTDAHKRLRRQIHLALQQADFDFRRLQYNTVVSACMKMLNALEAADLPHDTDQARGATAAAMREAVGILLRVLYPVVPHVTHVLWQEMGFCAQYGELLDAPWPEVDARALEQDTLEIVVQVNGKLRGRVNIAVSADESAAREAALADEHVMKFVGDKPLRKVIFVPGKLVNLVV